jgi:ATP-dependent RNA helicase DHX57
MVRGDSKVSQATRILFCTYGVLLRRLQEDPDLGAITHVVLDEVHERGMESDFAMALLTQSARRRAGLNIVLMSATIATDRFATYLGAATGLEGKAPVLEIPGRTFPVADFYKNSYEERVLELAHLRAYRDDDDVGYGDHSARRGGGSGAPASDRIDYQLAAALLGVLTDGTGADDSAVGAMLEPAQGAILVFLPGVPEIDRMARVLSSSTVGRRRTAVFPLHGALSPADQKQVFAPLSRDKSGSAPLKIVLSTNVAEASVTIPDVTVVVDTCRVKESGFDAERGMTSLLTKFCAKDSMRQRMGRAGRVSAGRCFRLITSGTYEKLPAHGLPEMKRVPLDRLVLQCSQMLHVRRQQRAATGQVVKAQKDAIVPPLERCFRMLRACPDPPEKAAVEGAHQSLMECRALQQDGTITPLGQHLAALPCTPRLGRILIYGALLGCAAPCAAVAAALITRSPFLSQRDPADRKRADQARARLAGTNGRQTQNSDHLVLAAAVSAYRAVSSHGAKRLFCRDHCLSAERMAEVCQQQEDLLDGLVQLGFVANRRAALAHSRDGPGAARLLAGAICAGLYPQLVRIIKPPKRFIATHSGAVEREAEGKEIKYFLTDKDALPHAEPTDPKEREYAARDANIDTKGMRRIFVHPSSVNFHAGSYQSFYLVYGELTGDANRTYVRDCTEVSAFPLLLFGGALATNYSEGTVTVDNNVRFQAPGRIVALVEKLRAALDVLLEDKIADPFLDVESSVERAAAVEVITCDGI